MGGFTFQRQQRNRYWLKKNLIPPRDKYDQKYALIYLLKRYLFTYFFLKKRSAEKPDRHLGVLFFFYIFRHEGRGRAPPIHL